MSTAHLVETLDLALEKAIPGFEAGYLDLDSLDDFVEQHGHEPDNDLPIPHDVHRWLYDTLGDDYLIYVEWNEFVSELDSLSNLVPIQTEGVEDLSIDVDDLEQIAEDDLDSPSEYFLEQLNQQLLDHNLQIAELCLSNERFEDGYLICISTDQDSVTELRAALNPFGIDIYQHAPHQTH